MKLTIANLTDFNQFVDLGLTGDINETICIGPRAKVKVNVKAESIFISLTKKFKNILSIRKI